MLPFIKVALKKYKVKFRARFFTQGSHWRESRKILEALQKESFFSIDDSWKMSLETYKESFLLVCGVTTMKNTFPILTLCPSLVLSDKSDVFNENLGIVCGFDVSPSVFLDKVRRIDATREKWRERILKYRQNSIYHFQKASCFLAQFIANLLKENYGAK